MKMKMKMKRKCPGQAVLPKAVKLPDDTFHIETDYTMSVLSLSFLTIEILNGQ